MNISYEYYKTFYYVAKYKNLTIAARELNNNQPNISRTIKLLEQNLGCKLIIRKSRGIDLTPEGTNLFFYVKNAVEQLSTAESELTNLSSLKSGTVTIGVSETATYMILLPALSAFKASYPDIKVMLHSHNTATAVDLAKQGLVDFSITTVIDEVDAPIKATPILNYSDRLIGGPSYKNTSGPLSLREISELPLICLSKSSSTYRFYKTLFDKNSLPFDPIYEVETTGQLCPMLIYDLGVAFVPEIYVRNSLQMGLVHEIPLCEELPKREICIIENKSRFPNPAAEKLKEFCMLPREYFSF